VFSIFITTAEGRDYLLKTKTTLTVTADTDNFGIIKPGTTLNTNITITYEYGRLARPKGFPFPKKRTPTTINLTITTPKWCTPQLNQGHFEIDVETFIVPKTKTENLSAKLTIKVDDLNAPAYEEGTITIKATAEENGNIQPSSAIYEIKITPGFTPGIEATLSNKSISLKPGEEKNISIHVKNKSNYKIIANLTTTTLENLNVTLPTPTTIEIDEKTTFPIKIKATEKQINVNETITFTVSYHAYDHPEATGTPINITLKTQIKSKKTAETTLALPAIIAIIATILVFLPPLLIYMRHLKKEKHIPK
jgi:hypothetical protein